jgi:Flp pilus assembly protein CpaB
VLADPLARRYWAAAIVLALASGVLVHRSAEAGRRAEQAWGRTVPVVVAARPLDAGDDLRGATEVVRWPAVLVPEGARTTVGAGERAAATIGAGTLLTDADVATGRGPLGDRRLVAVPVGEVVLPLAAGDRVELWATRHDQVGDLAPGGDRRSERSDGGRAQPLVDDGRVVEVLDRATVVAVPTDDVASVTRALATEEVTLVGVP